MSDIGLANDAQDVGSRLWKLCARKIWDAIQWTPTFTPRRLRAQLDQTDKVSYYMKGKRKEQFRVSESMIHLRRLVEYGDYLYDVNFEVDRKGVAFVSSVQQASNLGGKTG